MTRLALALSLDVPGSVRGGGAPVAAIVISANTTPENSTAGTTVGTLSTVLTTGTAVFSLVDNAGSRFALSGAIIQRGATALDYETSTYHNIVVGVTGVTPTISNTTLTINVTNISEIPVLSVQPTLSPTSGAVGTLITCGTGTWTNTPTSYAYQWMRTGVDISGATSSTYTSVIADDTFTLTCKVLASNADGPASGYSTTSNSHAVGSASLALDSYTVGVAYSLRKLLTAYAGNCIRIRRSSDNAEQDIGFVSNVVDTASIATFIGGGTGWIVSWYDQSGNTLTMTQAIAAGQPQFIASGMNSKPIARFDSDAGFSIAGGVAITTLSATNQTTIMFVQNQSSAASNHTTFAYTESGGSATTFACHATYADTLYFQWGNNTTGSLSAAQPSGWDNAAHITEMYRTTGNSQGIVVDGVSLTTSSMSTLPAGTGSFNFGYTGPAYFVGDMAEAFILKTDIGSSPRSTVRANMGAYYGVTVS